MDFKSLSSQVKLAPHITDSRKLLKCHKSLEKTLELMRTPWKPPTDLYESTILSMGPICNVNPFVDIEIIAYSYLTASWSIKDTLPFRQGTERGNNKNISPFHVANFLSSQLTPIVALLIFFNTKMLDIGLLPYIRGLNQNKL
jgi:hypothetical protein